MVAKKKELTEEQQNFSKLIKEIRECCKKLEEDELVDILEQYDSTPIEDITDLLLEWNIFFEKIDKKGSKGKKNDYTIPWIDIKGNSYKVTLLLSVQKDQSYDFKFGKNKMQYCIVLNRSENNSIFYNNTEIKYDTKEERDTEYENIKQKLTKFGVVFV